MSVRLRQIPVDEFVGKPLAHGDADPIVVKAVNLAAISAYNDGLAPLRNEDDELVYRPQQAMKAASHGRQDAAASLMIQIEQLKLVRSIRRLCMASVLLLIYVAYRLI